MRTSDANPDVLSCASEGGNDNARDYRGRGPALGRLSVSTQSWGTGANHVAHGFSLAIPRTGLRTRLGSWGGSAPPTTTTGLIAE
jgi:hypothetical protein